MTVSKFQRPRPITNHILPLFKIKAQFYPFQSLSEPPLAFQIYCSKMLICPHRENTNWFLKVWSIIFLVPSKPHLSSNQWRLLSISPGAHLTINPLVVDGDKLYVCSSPGTTWCITCASPVHHLTWPAEGFMSVTFVSWHHCQKKGWARTFSLKSFYKKSGRRGKHRCF